MGTDPDCMISTDQANEDNLVLESDGLRIAARLFRPAAEGPWPAVVACHGFGSSKESHAEFGQAAAARGFCAMTLDFRGHGASEGCLDSRTLNDVGCALSWLGEQPHVDARRIALRGSSMGAYFAIHAAARWEERVAAVVAICPATEEGLLDLLAEAKDPESFYGRWRASGDGFPRVMGCDLSCWLEVADIHDAVQELAPRPLLLIHCAGDEVVPIAASEELFAEAREPKTFWRLPGGDHRFAQHDPATTKRTLDWLATALGTSSGR